MKVSELHAKRKSLIAERDALLAVDTMTVEQESRGHEVANEIQHIDGEIRSAQLRERFASYTAMEKAVGESQKRNTDWVASTEYRDQFSLGCAAAPRPSSAPSTAEAAAACWFRRFTKKESSSTSTPTPWFAILPICARA